MNEYVEMGSADVYESAPAKINPVLRVMGRREDGYHELETVVLPLTLADHLAINAAAGNEFRTLSLSLSVEGRTEITGGVPADESNLVLRAAKSLADHAGVRGFAEVSLVKEVPAAAGLGGGSSDAAATLRVLNDLWGCGLSSDELGTVAASVGSDVPALLPGGPVMVRGRGERVEPVRVPRLTWLLVTFDFGVSTRDAFGWWDEDGGVTGSDPADLLAALNAPNGSDRAGTVARLAPLLFNDLQGPVVRRHQPIQEAMDTMREFGAAASILCGSGPSVAGLFPSTHDREPLSKRLEEVSHRRPIWVASQS